MPQEADELLTAASRLERLCISAEADEIKIPLGRLDEAAKGVGKAWSGSWLGYQSCVYYDGFNPPPAGAHFSSEWGLKEGYFGGETSGSWTEYTFDYVKEAIYGRAGNPDLAAARTLASQCVAAFEEIHPLVVSLMETVVAQSEDSYLGRLRDEVNAASVLSETAIITRFRPSGQFMSRDSLALSQGFWTPPHIAVIAEVAALRAAPEVCAKLARTAGAAASHLERRQHASLRSERIGTNVFIGHGQSRIWKDLKDFVQDRLRLPWDEFNRVPVAGITNIARLSQMLDSAAIAFLVLTAEDEHADGALHARTNVVHEAGLFQGRLGFTKAIVLLEEGCEEFSNIHGLGQVRFPMGNVAAVFEEVRRVLEREGLVQPVE